MSGNAEDNAEQAGPARAGPSRAGKSKRGGERPPTAFALAPVKVNPLTGALQAPAETTTPDLTDFSVSDDAQDQPMDMGDDDVQEEDAPQEEEPEEPEEPAAPTGPTRSEKKATARPPTTFVTTPIKPNINPSLGGPGPQRAANSNVARPGTTIPRGNRGGPRGNRGGPGGNRFVARGPKGPGAGGAPRTPPAGGEAPAGDLVEKEKKEAAQFQSLKVNANDLIQYNSAEDIFQKSQAASALRPKVGNLYILEQLLVCLLDPSKCKLFGTISSGLGEQRIQELHNKMKCLSIQLVTRISDANTLGMIFRHNLLDRLFLELMQAPAPLNDLSTHYLREVVNHLLKTHKEQVLKYLAAKAPGKSQSRAQLMFTHFYADNITYLFDELLTAEESMAQQQQASGGARGGRGGPPGSPSRGAPRGRAARGGPRGGPPGRGRGGPPGRGRGGPRGGPPGRGGRGGGPASGPAGGRQDMFRFSRTFNLKKELEEQFLGGKETGSDKMVAVRAQLRLINSAHVYQGLLFRGWDFPTISAILKDLGPLVDQIVGNWMGLETMEYQIKVLVALLKFINKQWNPSTPRGKIAKDAADALIRDRLCQGSMRKALDNPKGTLPKLKIIPGGSNTTVGAMRIQILHLASFIPLVRFLDVYVDDFIKSGILKTALDLFFSNPHHFFLHETVARSLLMNVMKCKNDKLFTHLFVDCHLLERIMDNFSPHNKPRTKDPSSYASFNGHLRFLANNIRDGKFLQRAGLSSKLSCVDKWNTFLANEIKTANQL